MLYKLLTLALFLLPPPAAAAQDYRPSSTAEEEIIIVVNSDSPFGPEITHKQLSDIFLNKQKYYGQLRLVPLNQDDKALFKRFLKELLEITPNKYRQELVAITLSEGWQAPASLPTQQELLDKVLRNKGAIGYVWKNHLMEQPGIRVLRVVGAPGESALPFQKVLEAASSALDQEDYGRLRKLTHYLAPEFKSYRRRSGENLHYVFEMSIDNKSAKAVEDVLVKLAFANLLAQFDFPKDAAPAALHDRVRLAYLDYHSMLSRRVKEKDLAADAFIRGCFQKIFLDPYSECLAVIIAKISESLDIPEKPEKP